MPNIPRGDAVEPQSLNWSLQAANALKSKEGTAAALVWLNLVVDLYAYIDDGHNAWVTIGRNQQGQPLVTYNITGQQPLRASGWSLEELQDAVRGIL